MISKLDDVERVIDKADDVAKVVDKADDLIKVTDKADDIAKVADKADDVAKAVDKADDLAKVTDKTDDAAKAVSEAEKVDVELKYKEGWTDIQKAEADAKVKALSEATTVKTPAKRSGTSAASRYKSAYGKESIPSGYDIDHTIDLQLGGADEILNLNPLDMSVNRSLGTQIKNKIKDLPIGTVFGEFTIK